MCTTEIEGSVSAAGKRFAIVAGRWNGRITNLLIDGAVDAIVRHGGTESDITLVRVPGSFEIPLICKELALSRQFGGVIAVGTLIRGETDHYRLVADQLASGLMKVSLETMTPITFGVVTAEDSQQATERASGKSGNKGWEAAVAAIEMANVILEIGKLKG